MAIYDKGLSWQVNVHKADGERFIKNYPKDEFSRTQVGVIELGVRQDQCKGSVSGFGRFEDIVPKYLLHEQNKIHDGKDKVYKNLCRMIYNHLMPFFRGMLMDVIPSTEIDRYVAKRKKEISAKCASRGGFREINLELMCLASISKWACSKEVGLASKPLTVTLLPCKRKIPILWTPEELRLLFACFSPRDRALGLCLYQAGCRIDEALNLTWDRVHFDQGYLHLVGKFDKERFVPMTTEVYFSLWNLAEARRPSTGNVVFRSRATGGELGDWKSPLKTAKRKSGVKKRIYPHLLRHCFATYTLEASGDVYTLQGNLGHGALASTVWYLQWMMAAKKKQMEAAQKSMSINGPGVHMVTWGTPQKAANSGSTASPSDS